MSSFASLPIGVLDSGFGGLSVTKAIANTLPRESIIYAADCEYAPWGERTDDYINTRVDALVDFLLTKQIKALVVACNTATAVSIERLRTQHPNLLILGIEPAIKPACALSKTQVIGVLATPKTIESDRYQALKRLYGINKSVLDMPCPGLMQCVEKGEFSTPETQKLLKEFIDPLVAQDADTLVLGCTHYPFLSETILGLYSDNLTLIDPAPAVAKNLARLLEIQGLCQSNKNAPDYFFYASGANSQRQKTLESLWSKRTCTLNNF